LRTKPVPVIALDPVTSGAGDELQMAITDADIERDATELQEFRRSAMLFSNGASLIAKYDGRWVAAINGEVRAASPTYEGIFEQMQSKGIDARYALVRHIQRNQRTLVI
jgi:hypothetical protein